MTDNHSTRTSLRPMPLTRSRYVGEVMTNFDNTIDHEVAKALVAPDAYAVYLGQNFSSVVWAEGELFHAEVQQRGQYVVTHSGTLEELMNSISSKYGRD